MSSVLCRHGAGLNLEFLQGVRERERKIHGIEQIVVHGAIQQIAHTRERSAGNRDIEATRETGRPVGASGNGRACQLDQFYRISPVEWQIDNALVVYQSADAGGLGFHLRGVGLYLDALADGAHLKGHVQGRIRSHLQHDSGLNVRGESRLGYFYAIRPDRQIHQNVSAVAAAGGGPHYACISLSGLDFGVRNCRARRI